MVTKGVEKLLLGCFVMSIHGGVVLVGFEVVARVFWVVARVLKSCY